jgi:hypothetical protein
MLLDPTRMPTWLEICGWISTMINGVTNVLGNPLKMDD